MKHPVVTPIKTALALTLGLVALVGMWVSKKPDGNHFFGRFRDDIRVERIIEQMIILSDAIRKHHHTGSSYGITGTDLTPALIASSEIPEKMINHASQILLSPWGTEITLLSEGSSFLITVPVSSYGCYRLMLALGKTTIAAAYANGVQQSLPISSISDIKGCIRLSINTLTFSFK